MALTENLVNQALGVKSLKMACKTAFNLKNGLNATKSHQADLYRAVVELGKPWPKGWKIPKIPKQGVCPMTKSVGLHPTLNDLPSSLHLFCPGCGAMITYTEPKATVHCLKCGRNVSYRVVVRRMIEITTTDN
ncbi:MAG: hypothetical protein RDU76_06145 [Candidatus Edwardsbacteria bacterium]|nr:hypothetical protein [Candidatus Edwardsbacteria bacterium]